MESIQLEAVLRMLGLNSSDIPKSKSNHFHLYATHGNDPIAKLFLNNKGYTLRFGYDVMPRSSVDALPSGGIRVKPRINI